MPLEEKEGPAHLTGHQWDNSVCSDESPIFYSGGGNIKGWNDPLLPLLEAVNKSTVWPKSSKIGAPKQEEEKQEEVEKEEETEKKEKQPLQQRANANAWI